MIRLADILKASEYAHYHNLRYGLSEQKHEKFMPFQDDYYQYGPVRSGEDLVRNAKKNQEARREILDGLYENRHEILFWTEIAAAVLIPPPVGLIVAGAIGLSNAALYAYEGRNFEAGLTALFALLPGVPSWVSKVITKPAFMRKVADYLRTRAARAFNTEELKVVKFIDDVLLRAGSKKSAEAQVKFLLQRQARNISYKIVNNQMEWFLKVGGRKYPQMIHMMNTKIVTSHVRYVANRRLNQLIVLGLRGGGLYLTFELTMTFYTNVAMLYAKAYEKIEDMQLAGNTKHEFYTEILLPHLDKVFSAANLWSNIPADCLPTVSTASPFHDTEGNNYDSVTTAQHPFDITEFSPEQIEEILDCMVNKLFNNRWRQGGELINQGARKGIERQTSPGSPDTEIIYEPWAAVADTSDPNKYKNQAIDLDGNLINTDSNNLTLTQKQPSEDTKREYLQDRAGYVDEFVSIFKAPHLTDEWQMFDRHEKIKILAKPEHDRFYKWKEVPADKLEDEVNKILNWTEYE